MFRRLLITSAAALALPLAAPATAPAAFQIEFCTQANPAPPGIGAPGWGSILSGTSLTAGGWITTWQDACSKAATSMPERPDPGFGASFDGRVTLGSQAMLTYTPPPGTVLSGITGRRTLAAAPDGFAAPGIFTSAGRPLTDIAPYLAGQGGVLEDNISITSSELGADGAAGVRWGAYCPTAPSDPIVTWCRSAVLAIENLRISLTDPTPPSAELTGHVDAAGNATLSWTASDTESGIGWSRLIDGYADQYRCHPQEVPGCPITMTGTKQDPTPLMPGETRTYTLQAFNRSGEPAERSLTLTRAATPPVQAPDSGQPPATSPPIVPPVTNHRPPAEVTPRTPTNSEPSVEPQTIRSRVTLKLRRSGRKITARGTARGCKRVRITVGGRTRTTKVFRSGRWTYKTTIRTARKTTLTAKCGKRRASARR